MEGYTLQVTRREESGKGAAGRYRRQGLIPAMIYGKHSGNVPGLLPYFEFVNSAGKAKISQIFVLKSEDKEIDGKPALVREIQRDYLTGKLIHVDLLALREDEEIEVEIGVATTGEPIGVKLDGGVMTVVLHNIMVSCLPKNIPSEIRVDVTELRVGSSLHASDLPLPEGVRLVTHAEEAVVIVAAQKAEAAPAAEEAAAAAATPAAAPAAAAGAKAAPAAQKEKK